MIRLYVYGVLLACLLCISSSGAYANAAVVLMSKDAERQAQAAASASGCTMPNLSLPIFKLSVEYWEDFTEKDPRSEHKWSRSKLYFNGDAKRGSVFDLSPEYPPLHKKVAELLPNGARVVCVQFVGKKLILFYQQPQGPSQ